MQRSRGRWRWHLALPRLALPRADRRVGLQHHSVLGFGRIEQRAALYLYGYRFYRPLDHFCRRSSLRFKRGLDVLDHGLELLVRQILDQIAVLDLVLARDQQRQNLQVRGGLCSAHTFYRLRAAVPEVSEQSRNKLAIQLLAVTRADRTAGWVSIAGAGVVGRGGVFMKNSEANGTDFVRAKDAAGKPVPGSAGIVGIAGGLTMPEPEKYSNAGVFGQSATGPGVNGLSTDGIGVVGVSTNNAGVSGVNTSTGRIAAGPIGVNAAGVHGFASDNPGGLFMSQNVAQLRLFPFLPGNPRQQSPA